jgi:hypothetical protein
MLRFLRVDLDYDTDSPCESDSWKVYSFNFRHNSYKDPFMFIDRIDQASGAIMPSCPGLRQKLDRGLAFWLTYTEHGDCNWYVGARRSNSGYLPDGLMVWESKPTDLGPKTLLDREKDAEAFLAVYTDWCNGNCYGYHLKDEVGETVDSCWGFIGFDSLIAEINSHLEEGDQIVLSGEMEDVVRDYGHLKGEIVDECDLETEEKKEKAA